MHVLVPLKRLDRAKTRLGGALSAPGRVTLMRALVANAASFGLLWAYRHGDANMRSAWICTRNDVLGSNEDLIAAAAELLASGPVRALSATVSAGSVTVTTAKVSRLDIIFDGRPFGSMDVTDGPHGVSVPAGVGVIDLRGYDEGQLVAARRLSVPAP